MATLLKPKIRLRAITLSLTITGDSGEIRTHDPRFRRPLLYPAELPNHISNINYYM